MSLTPLQMDQVRTKVSYSEVDLPYNGYMDILAKVTRLSGNILKGQLQKYSEQQKVEFNDDYVQELETTADQKFLELQSSLDVKKVAQENWDQSNSETVRNMEEKIQDVMPKLEEIRDSLQNRTSRVRELYDSVSKVNNELEVLLEGRTSLTASKPQWEKELGVSLTEKLIGQNYLRKTGSNGEEKYRVYDNFTKGPNELRHTNKAIKIDIERLSEELGTYKTKWLKDADIFSQMTSALREEMGKRDLDIQQAEDEDEEMEDDEEPEDEPEDNEPEDENMLEEEQVGEAAEQADEGSEEQGEEPIEEEAETKGSQKEIDSESTPGS
ncbi:hypothetical protein ZYGR_0AG06020 [Zygosaccharomyces rouxii]|uniref:Uncharacterized protein n=1 Tax=Zygosaccharomyces rouxii TaxID=4956 RepID=A0A1Q3AAF8_ZYGRO|nr:hypothetical protein ZYGR_0AG06020 [Zygosaccharomyces rouxii]